MDKISKEFFEKVDSQMKNGNFDEPWFFQVVRAGFAHKRKVLKGNLAHIIPAQALEKLWKEKNWPMDARAETFTLESMERYSQRKKSFPHRTSKIDPCICYN